MRIGLYSTAWGLRDRPFDFKGSLDNWAVYADQISIAIGSDDGTYEVIDGYAKERGYPVSLIRTTFDFTNDPFAYGKTENAALQNCDGDLLLQANLDERWGSTLCTKARLIELGHKLYETQGLDTFFIPNIDLYGSTDRYVKIGAKWYMGRKGLKRGAVQFGIKENGRPDYNKTSSDEALREDGSLVSTYPLLQNPTIENLRAYVQAGMPLVYHVGYLSLTERASRAAWWDSFWKMATLGDANSHITDVEELEKRHTFEHNLPLWPTL